MSPDEFVALALAEPIAQGAATFGYAMRVAGDNPRPPGAIGLTWRTQAHSGANR